MKRGLLAALVTVVLSGSVLCGTALADPGGPNLQPGELTFVCDNGDSVTLNPGTATNQGRVGWVKDSTAVFVLAYYAVTDGDFIHVFFDIRHGVGDLLTCSADIGGGAMFVARGFLTPR
jgi:hypothetical protein